jgi:hypothetical protein
VWAAVFFGRDASSFSGTTPWSFRLETQNRGPNQRCGQLFLYQKGQELSQKDKGFIFIDLSQKGQKGQKTSRVFPWGFETVKNILVFSLFL